MCYDRGEISSKRITEAINQNDEAFILDNIKTICRTNKEDEYGFGLIEVTLLGYPKKTNITHLLLNGGCRPVSETKDEETAVFLLLDYREADIELMNRLIDAGVDINKRTRKGSDALSMAILKGRLDLLKELIGRGASIRKYENNRTILMIAASHSEDYRVNIIDYLIKNNISNVNDLDDNGRDALYYAIRSGNRLGVLRLIRAGADLNRKYDEGKTSLALAREKTNKEIARILEKEIKSRKN
jgi:ankyrin repeat protein